MIKIYLGDITNEVKEEAQKDSIDATLITSENCYNLQDEWIKDDWRSSHFRFIADIECESKGKNIASFAFAQKHIFHV